MSTHDDDHAGHGHASDSGADAHDHFDAEPATSLSTGENPSPAWLPVLGAGLFLIGGTYFLATPSSAEPGPAPSASASQSAGPAAVRPPPAPTAPGAPKPIDPALVEKARQLAAGLPAPSAAAPKASASAAPVVKPGPSGQPPHGGATPPLKVQ